MCESKGLIKIVFISVAKDAKDFSKGLLERIYHTLVGKKRTVLSIKDREIGEYSYVVYCITYCVLLCIYFESLFHITIHLSERT